ncbi:AEC family transporter [Oceanobacillus halophilus]|uniref:AEC family transporter n=1 Tax=Oceanobacillus halophilus TaxID=930130 RepID=A0A495A372_9BACI|nr:AEC family transporter [Oceanobacillus halophilus]RKQ34007.1 AEC family transporter [Oceanobacillus halophilus]
MLILFQVVIPIFAIIICGFLAGRLSLLPFSGTSSLNYFVYYFSLPALLFFSVSTAPVEQLANVDFILANLFLILTCFILTVLIFKIFFKKKFPEVSMYGMITTYGNTGFLGIPLLVAAFGQEAAVPAAIVTFIYDLTIITLIIVSFEVTKVFHKRQQEKRNILPLIGLIVKSVLFNPINASLLLGIIVAISRVSIPQPIYVFTETLGPAAGPTALFALGLGLSSERNVLKNKHYQLSEFITLLSLKLIILPLLAILFVYVLFPLENELWATSVVILSALPTGALVYVFAEKYNTLVKQVPLYILATTAISIITISIFLVLTMGGDIGTG